MDLRPGDTIPLVEVRITAGMTPGETGTGLRVARPGEEGCGDLGAATAGRWSGTERLTNATVLRPCSLEEAADGLPGLRLPGEWLLMTPGEAELRGVLRVERLA